MANSFQSTLLDSGDSRPPISGLDFASVPSLEAQALEVPFIEEEVLAALSCLNGDKAPGPNGFSMAFWQACWDVVKNEVMGFFAKFHKFGTFQRSINATLLPRFQRRGEQKILRTSSQLAW